MDQEGMYSFEDDFRSSLKNDIVIQDEPKKIKNKKPIIIGLAVLIIAVVISLAIVLISQSQKGDHTTTQLSRAFNQYANYLLSGEESDKKVEKEYTYGSDYYIGTLESDKYEEYFKTLREKYNAFAEAYEAKTKKNPDYTLNGYIPEEYIYSFKLYTYNAENPIYSDPDINELYVTEIRTSLFGKVEKHYEKYANDDNMDIKTIGTESIDMAKKLIGDAYDIFQANGCIDKEDMIAPSTECLTNNKEPFESANNTIKNYTIWHNEIEAELTKARDITYEQLWTMMEQIYEE